MRTNPLPPAPFIVPYSSSYEEGSSTPESTSQCLSQANSAETSPVNSPREEYAPCEIMLFSLANSKNQGPQSRSHAIIRQKPTTAKNDQSFHIPQGSEESLALYITIVRSDLENLKKDKERLTTNPDVKIISFIPQSARETKGHSLAKKTQLNTNYDLMPSKAFCFQLLEQINENRTRSDDLKTWSRGSYHYKVLTALGIDQLRILTGQYQDNSQSAKFHYCHHQLFFNLIYNQIKDHLGLKQEDFGKPSIKGSLIKLRSKNLNSLKNQFNEQELNFLFTNKIESLESIQINKIAGFFDRRNSTGFVNPTLMHFSGYKLFEFAKKEFSLPNPPSDVEKLPKKNKKSKLTKLFNFSKASDKKIGCDLLEENLEPLIIKNYSNKENLTTLIIQNLELQINRFFNQLNSNILNRISLKIKEINDPELTNKIVKKISHSVSKCKLKINSDNHLEDFLNCRLPLKFKKQIKLKLSIINLISKSSKANFHAELINSLEFLSTKEEFLKFYNNLDPENIKTRIDKSNNADDLIASIRKYFNDIAVQFTAQHFVNKTKQYYESKIIPNIFENLSDNRSYFITEPDKFLERLKSNENFIENTCDFKRLNNLLKSLPLVNELVQRYFVKYDQQIHLKYVSEILPSFISNSIHSLKFKQDTVRNLRTAYLEYQKIIFDQFNLYFINNQSNSADFNKETIVNNIAKSLKIEFNGLSHDNKIKLILNLLDPKISKSSTSEIQAPETNAESNRIITNPIIESAKPNNSSSILQKLKSLVAFTNLIACINTPMHVPKVLDPDNREKFHLPICDTNVIFERAANPLPMETQFAIFLEVISNHSNTAAAYMHGTLLDPFETIENIFSSLNIIDEKIRKLNSTSEWDKILLKAQYKDMDNVSQMNSHLANYNYSDFTKEFLREDFAQINQNIALFTAALKHILKISLLYQVYNRKKTPAIAELNMCKIDLVFNNVSIDWNLAWHTFSQLTLDLSTTDKHKGDQ